MEKEKVLGGIMGLCIGDALGVPFEGVSREDMEKNPVKDLGGKAIWSDDSSLTLCLAESLTGGFDLSDIGHKFVRWLDEGYMTPEGESFGIGRTTYMAIDNIKKGKDSSCWGLKDEYSNGNGSLMRILPVAFYCQKLDIDKRFELTSRVSAITHAHPRSIIGCCIYVQMAIGLLKGLDKREAYRNTMEIIRGYFEGNSQLSHFSRVLFGDLSQASREDICSGGYIIDTLQSGLWCLLRNDNYCDTVLDAVNLGRDTDTTAAVAGGLAGVMYGIKSIPRNWIDKLARKDDILRIAERFYNSIDYGS
jgi:ADP-ribosyl-[dinitrogen reductase] hydrolase